MTKRVHEGSRPTWTFAQRARNSKRDGMTFTMPYSMILDRFQIPNVQSLLVVRASKAQAICLRDAALDPSCTGEAICRDAIAEALYRVGTDLR